MTKQEDLMQRALLESEQLYRRLIESAQDGILITDALTGLILEVNPTSAICLAIPPLKLWD